MSGITRLEHAILGLLLTQARSGYDVRRLFETTPIGHFSGGPGAIYPALRRLQAKGLIQQVRSRSTSRRRRELFRPTAAGRRAILRWLRAVPTRDDVVWTVEDQVLKLAFMGAVLTQAEISRFLRAYRREVSRYARELRSQLAVLKLPGIPRLALQHGIALYETRARWAARAIHTLSIGAEKE